MKCSLDYKTEVYCKLLLRFANFAAQYVLRMNFQKGNKK